MSLISESRIDSAGTMLVGGTLPPRSGTSTPGLRLGNAVSHYEMHPTYRALITLMKIAGFVNIQEIVSTAEPKNPNYTAGRRHALVGFKPS